MVRFPIPSQYCGTASPVNDDIALFEVGNELLDKVVYGFTSFNEEDNLSGSL